MTKSVTTYKDIRTLDLEAVTFYDTLLDCSYSGSTYGMEGDPMATSLLFALLDIDATTPPYSSSTPEGNAYLNLQDPQKTQVMEKLYDALYYIIEHSYMPHNEPLNMAIGEALARAVSAETGDVKNPSQLAGLRNILTLVVHKAIEDVS